ncbi:MAG: hypothetical protein INF34_01765, partial [Roseomonas sp.]|nr:hypothetical protein [Roseomonas sp.]
MRLKRIGLLVQVLVFFFGFFLIGAGLPALAQTQPQAPGSNIIPGMPSFPRNLIPVLPGVPSEGVRLDPPPVFDQRSLADLPGQSRATERAGSPTQAEGGPTLVTPLGDLQRSPGAPT